MDQKKIPPLALLAYAAPSLTIAGIMGYPLVALVPPFYAASVGISLSTIGVVILVSRMFDGVTDLLIGYLSDHTKSPIGRRKPWLVVGAPLMSICIYFLFVPPNGAGAFYFAGFMFALYFCWTMIEIPYKAWASELSRDYNERSRITTYLAIFGAAGGILFLAVPLLPSVQSAESAGAGLRVMALGFVALTVPLMMITVATIPQGHHVAVKSSDFVTDIRSMATNKLFLRFLTIYCLYGSAVGINGAALFFFISYLDIGSPTIVFAGLLIVFLAALVGMPVWLMIIKRIGKHRALFLAALLNACIYPLAFFIAPGPEAAIPALVCGVLLGLCAGPYNIVPLSMLSDIVDYDLVRGGVNRAGSYVSVQHLVGKLNASLGGAAAFFILDMFGFQASGGSDAVGVLGLKVVALGIPTVFFLLSLLFISGYPLDAKRHATIQKRLEGLPERGLSHNAPPAPTKGSA